MLVYGFLALLISAWLVTGYANRDTGQNVNHVSGAWVALSHWATQGVYYPPLEAEGYFGGTRFGPLAIALQAGAHALFDDALVGPKLLHLLYMLALCSGLWVLLRPMKLPGHLRLLLAVAPIATTIGWTAGLTIRHDALATALQVWALAVLVRRDGVTALGVVLASVLTALAVLSKVSALWGASVCFFYLLAIAPKRLLIFIPVWWVTVIGGLLLAEWASGGGFSENMRHCLFPNDAMADPKNANPVLTSCYKLIAMTVTEPVVLLTMLLTLLTAWGGRNRAPHVSIAFVMVMLMSMYLLSKAGIDSNHLIDMVAVGCLGAGLWFSARTEADAQPGRAYNAVVYALLVCCVMMVVMPPRHNAHWGTRYRHIAQSLADVTGVKPKATAEQLVREQLDPDEKIISFNPLVPVLLGQDPIVSDSWMLRIHFANHPDSEDRFIQRIKEQAFDAFVFDIFAGPELDFHPQHFGHRTLEAVRTYYEPEEVKAYTVFRPKERKAD